MSKHIPTSFRLIFSACGLALCSMSIQAAGALAIDSHQGGHYGFITHAATQEQAKQKVMHDCGEGCQVVLQFNEGCAAFAMDQSSGRKAYGWGMLKSLPDSQNRAMAACEARGGKNCKVAAAACEKS